MKRTFDIIFSLSGLILLLPLFLYLAVRIRIDTQGNIFFRQKRVGKHGREFYLYKFRSMRSGAEKGDALTQGTNDNRITAFGAFLRKYKLDELPQLANVLLGDMSIVGPRPEVMKYTRLYTAEQRTILNVKPGITDMASIIYFNESEILEQQPAPEDYYVNHILPEKIKLNQQFITSPSLYNYFRIIGLTIKKIATRTA